MAKAQRALQLPLFYEQPAWQPPTAPLDLTGVRRLCVDVERRDTQLSALGSGTFRSAYITGIAVGTDDGRRAYYPIRHEGGGNCAWDVVAWAKRDLNAFSGDLVGANLVYDLEALAYEHGVTFPNVRRFDDVSIAEAVIDEWRFRYSLEALSQDYLGEGKVEGRLREVADLHGWKTEGDVKQNLWRLSGLDVGEYGEGDVDRPLRILPLQLEKLAQDEQEHIYDLERRLIPVLVAMRLRGVRVAPTDRIEEVRTRLLGERDRWAAEVKRLLGRRAELNSSVTLGEGLAQRGLPVPMTAGSKKSPPKWSVTKEFLERHKGDAAVNAIAAGRRVNTLVSLTLDSLLEHRTADGRVHCELNPLKGEDDNGKRRGTIARFSCNHPNLQQIPSRQSEFDELLFDGDFDVTSEIRGLFLPEDGEVWESADESQVEYRLLVHYAVGRGSDEARERYVNDPSTDYHKFAAETMRIDPNDMKRRKRVKNLNFAYAYGARDAKLAVTFNCPLPEATAFRVEFENKVPFVKATYDKANEWAQKRGYVVTVLDRKCRFPLWEPRGNYGAGKLPGLLLEDARREYPKACLVRADTYKALNRKLQGSGAEILKKAMVEAHESGVTKTLGAFLLTVHDELDTSVPRTRAGAEASRELSRLMENCVQLRVPLRVKVERGESWGAVSESYPLLNAA